MRRRLTYMFLVIFAVATLVVAAGIGWVISTTQGARWILDQISQRTALEIRTEQLEGTLGRDLRVHGLTVSWPGGNAQIKNVRLRWRPILLLSCRFVITELAVENVTIQDNAPESKKEPGLPWPTVSRLFTYLFVRIDHFHVDWLHYQKIDQPPVVVKRFSGTIVLGNGFISANKVELDMPQGSAGLSLKAGLWKPSLDLDMQFIPAHPVAAMNRFTIRADLLPARAPDRVSGPVKVAAMSGPRTDLEVTGIISVAEQSVRVTGLRVLRPSMKGTATGLAELILAADQPFFRLQLNFSGIDVRPELAIATHLSGTLNIEGEPDRFGGDITIENKGEARHTAALSASFQGTSDDVRVAAIRGTWLGGTLRGDARASWKDTWSFAATLKARSMNPAALSPSWKGTVNADIAAAARWPRSGRPEGNLSLLLLESRLRGKDLTGVLRVRSSKTDVHLDQLLLRGQGFSMQAGGNLSGGIRMKTTVSDLSLFVPETRGSLDIEGSVRQGAASYSGWIKLQGRALEIEAIRSDSLELSAAVDEGKDYPFRFHTVFAGFTYKTLRADSIVLDGDGTLLNHDIRASIASPDFKANAALSGSYSNGEWWGTIERLSGRDAAGGWQQEAASRFRVSRERLSLSPIILKGGASENVKFDADVMTGAQRGSINAEWRQLNLARANHWLNGLAFSGVSDGVVHMQWLEPGRIQAAATAAASGTVTIGTTRIVIKETSLKGEWNERGLLAAATLVSERGRAHARVSSSGLPRAALPEHAEVSADWEGFDLAIIGAWVKDVQLSGAVSGRLKGTVYNGERFDVAGEVSLAEGALRRRVRDIEISAGVKKAVLSWTWRGDILRGSLKMALAEYGEVDARFTIPVPARLPVTIAPGGQVHAALTGAVQELGILTAFFPGLIEDSRGQLRLDLHVEGTWAKPDLKGSIVLDKAAGYFPAAGIHVTGVRVKVRLEQDRIYVDTVEARSGPGTLTGKAVIDMEQWSIAGFRGSFSGEAFEALYLPDLRVQLSPRIELEGTRQKVSVRGEILVPQFLTYGRPQESSIKPSSDVVITDGTRAPAELPVALDLEVKVVLGKHVLVKAEGADAQLGGSVELRSGKNNEILGTGEITVVKGRYSAYGVSLDIKRGRVLFAGGPVDNPGLDILALRRVGEVRAGVVITGSTQQPFVKLYSEPSMQDIDILAYIVLGHPLGEDRTQGLSLMQAADLLLSAGQSATLQDQMKQRLGVDTLDIETQAPSKSLTVPGQPAGAAPPTGPVAQSGQPAGDQVARSLITIGKYLTPRLYVSYGRSLFTGENEFRLRYSFSKRWEVETQTGIESGVDLFYKIDFD